MENATQKLTDTNASLNTYSCSKYEVIVYTALFVDWIVSCLFLWITVGVYFLLRKSFKFHGSLQFAFIIAVAILSTSMLIKQINRTRMVPAGFQEVYIAAYWFHQFTTYLAFCLLTAMNIDMWKCFRCLKAMLRNAIPEIHHRPWRKLLIYFIFCITGAVLATIVHYCTAVYIQQKEFTLPKSFVMFTMEERCAEYYTPSFYKGTSCKILILLCLFFLDTILFVLTCINIRSLQGNSQFRPDSGFTEEKQKFKMFIKLFWTMGIPYLVTAFDCLLGFLPVVHNMYVQIVRPITVLISLQGITIFFLLVCNKSTLIQLRSLIKK